MTLPRESIWSDKKHGTCQHSQGQLEDEADDENKNGAERTNWERKIMVQGSQRNTQRLEKQQKMIR